MDDPDLGGGRPRRATTLCDVNDRRLARKQQSCQVMEQSRCVQLPTATLRRVSYCVAFARTGARADAIAAGDRAAGAVTTHAARLTQAAAAPDTDPQALQINGGASGAYDEALNQIEEQIALREAREDHRVSMARVVADMWAEERPRLDAAIVACRGAAQAGSSDAACNFPSGMRTLNMSFQSQAEALADMIRRIRGAPPSAAPGLSH